MQLIIKFLALIIFFTSFMELRESFYDVDGKLFRTIDSKGMTKYYDKNGKNYKDICKIMNYLPAECQDTVNKYFYTLNYSKCNATDTLSIEEDVFKFSFYIIINGSKSIIETRLIGDFSDSLTLKAIKEFDKKVIQKIQFQDTCLSIYKFQYVEYRYKHLYRVKRKLGYKDSL